MGMEVDEHGTQSQEEQGAQGAEAQDSQVQVGTNGDGAAGADGVGEAGKGGGAKDGGKPDYAKMIAERDAMIAGLQAQIAEAAKSAEAAVKLAAQIEELKAQAADDKLEYALKLAGCRNVKAAKALMDDHDGDVEALKAAEPWMFEDGKSAQVPKGKTGLTPAGASNEDNATLKRWRKLAGLEDEETGGSV